MGIRRLVVVLSGVLALTVSTALSAQEGAAKRFEARDKHISRSQAIGLSLLFPGLGQLATGHRNKGTALMAVEMGCLVVWLTSHEDFNTQAKQFDMETERYLALVQGGTFEAAEESWQRLSDKKDDLDQSHLLRRAFGVLSLVVYGYNALDVLVYNGAEPAVEKSVSIAPMPRIGPAGLALVKRF